MNLLLASEIEHILPKNISPNRLRNDADPEMIPTFLLVDPEMIPKELGNGS